MRLHGVPEFIARIEILALLLEFEMHHSRFRETRILFDRWKDGEDYLILGGQVQVWFSAALEMFGRTPSVDEIHLRQQFYF